jgi:hypothetical protein
MAQLDEVVSKSNIQGVIEMDKALISLDETFMRVLKSSKETASVLNSSTASYANLKKAQEDTVKQTEKLSAAEKEAEKIAKEQAATLAALDKQRQTAYKKQFEAQQKAIEIENKRIAKEKELAAAIAMEVKSIKDAEVQNKALREIKSRLNLTTEEGRKKNEQYNQIINKNTEFIRKNSDAAKQQQMNIGNYPKVVSTITKSVSGLATGMLPMLGGFTLFKSLLTGTEIAGDKFEQITSAIGYSLKFLSDRLLSLDFKGLISGFRESWQEGVRYRQVLQEIEDLQVGLGLQEKAAQLRVAQLEYIAKSEKSTLEERKAALAEIQRIEADLRVKRIELSNKDTQNELENIAKLIFGAEGATEVRKTLILGLVNDQRAFNENIEAGTKIQEYLNSLIKVELDDRGRAHQDLRAYNSAMEALTDEQRLQLDIVEINDKLTGEQREKIAKAHGATIDALKAEQDAKNSLLRVENKLLRAEEERVANAEVHAARQADLTNMQFIEAKTVEESITELTKAELTLRTAAQEAYHDRMNELYEEDDLKREARDAAILGSMQVIQEAGTAIFEHKLSEIDEELSALNAARDAELEKWADNKAMQDKINNEYNKKESALRKKQAEQQKRQNLFNAIIGTALSIVQAIANNAPPLSWVLAAINAALGAVQIAAIASEPIPQFFKGTESAPDGLISVGEKGRELIQTRSGKVLMANDHTILSGMKGAKIYSNEETEAILKAGLVGYDSRELKTTLERNNERLIRTIQNKREVYLDFSTRKVSEREGGHWTHYKNRYFR